MAAEEINAQGGFLGKRKIETITADEAAGTDANVKELRRMKLDGKIDLFTGVISSANTPALGPVAEELALLTIFTDGCTDFLFDKAVPNPATRSFGMGCAPCIVLERRRLCRRHVGTGNTLAPGSLTENNEQ
jgi:hypothetical protein